MLFSTVDMSNILQYLVADLQLQLRVLYSIIRLHQMYEMQTTVTNVRGVLSVCSSMRYTTQLTWLNCVGSFGAAFAKSLWPLFQ